MNCKNLMVNYQLALSLFDVPKRLDYLELAPALMFVCAQLS